MSNKRQRLRKLVIKVWNDNTGSTAFRDTDYNDLCNKYNLPENYVASVWRKAKADIEA